MSAFFLIVSAVLALAGVAVLLLIWLRWPWVEGFAKQSRAKVAVALCRAALAGAGSWGRI